MSFCEKHPSWLPTLSCVQCAADRDAEISELKEQLNKEDNEWVDEWAFLKEQLANERKRADDWEKIADNLLKSVEWAASEMKLQNFETLTLEHLTADEIRKKASEK